MLAVIRIRGRANIRRELQYALNLLNLTRVNHLVLLAGKEEEKGMLKKVEPYITWGEISKETLEKLLEKRARLAGNKRLHAEFLKENKVKGFSELAEKVLGNSKVLQEIGIKRVFRLTPPKKGFERKGIKKSFSIGGVSGYRGEKINEIILRMI